MTILGNEFASILLCSGTADDFADRLSEGARRLEWEHRLTVFLRPLEGEPRPVVPAQGTRLYRIETEGEDRAGIVAGVCRVLADRNVNIADLQSRTQPSPSGGSIYQMSLLVEVPEPLDPAALAKELDLAGRRLAVDVRLEPAGRAGPDT